MIKGWHAPVQGAPAPRQHMQAQLLCGAGHGCQLLLPPAGGTACAPEAAAPGAKAFPGSAWPTHAPATDRAALPQLTKCGQSPPRPEIKSPQSSALARSAASLQRAALPACSAQAATAAAAGASAPAGPLRAPGGLAAAPPAAARVRRPPPASLGAARVHRGVQRAADPVHSLLQRLQRGGVGDADAGRRAKGVARHHRHVRPLDEVPAAPGSRWAGCWVRRRAACRAVQRRRRAWRGRAGGPAGARKLWVKCHTKPRPRKRVRLG
jgi:hypothetical protein